MDMSDEDVDSGDDPNYSPDDGESCSENESRTSTPSPSCTPPTRPSPVGMPVAATPPITSPVSPKIAGPTATVNINDDFQNIVWTDPVGRQRLLVPVVWIQRLQEYWRLLSQ